MNMKRKRILNFLPLLLLVAGAVFVASCSSDDDDDSVKTLTVASAYGYVNYMIEGQKAYIIKENGKGEWRSGLINGDFLYEPGNEYVIKVTKVYPEPGVFDAAVYYQFEGIVSKIQKDSEGIDPQMLYKDPPQGDELKEMVQNDELPELKLSKEDLPTWLAEKIESAEEEIRQGANHRLTYYCFLWKGMPYYLIRNADDTTWWSTVYSIDGTAEQFDPNELFAISRSWRIVYRVAPPEE